MRSFFVMPPKGTKGRPAGRTGNIGEGNNGGEQQIVTTPKGSSPISDGEPENAGKQNGNSDSDLNEEDSFLILKKILLNQKISEKKSDEHYTKLSKQIRESKKALEAYYSAISNLNAYVGKERIHCFSVVRPVAMTQMQLSWWSGATEIQNNSSLLVIKHTRPVILDFMCCAYGMFNKYLPNIYMSKQITDFIVIHKLSLMFLRTSGTMPYILL